MVQCPIIQLNAILVCGDGEEIETDPIIRYTLLYSLSCSFLLLLICYPTFNHAAVNKNCVCFINKQFGARSLVCNMHMKQTAFFDSPQESALLP